MGENLRTAMITATAVLFGGLIAGGASLATTIVNQNGENERLERQVDEEARGAARVLFSRFTVVHRYLEVSLNSGRYSQIARKLLIAPVSVRDLKLIASRVSADGFADVEDSSIATTGFFLLLRQATGERLGPFDRRTIQRFQVKVQKGRRALLEVADLPDYALNPARR